MGVRYIRIEVRNTRTKISNLRTDISNLRTEIRNTRTEIRNIRTDIRNTRIQISNSGANIGNFYYLCTDINQKTTDIMLIYNFQRVFAARGIDKPTNFLVNHGFPRGIASRMATHNTDKIFLKYLEKACLVLNCTPNDLIEWRPDNKKQDNADTALYALKKEQKGKGAEELLRGLPMSRLEELAKVLREAALGAQLRVYTGRRPGRRRDRGVLRRR